MTLTLTKDTSRVTLTKQSGSASLPERSVNVTVQKSAPRLVLTKSGSSLQLTRSGENVEAHVIEPESRSRMELTHGANVLRIEPIAQEPILRQEIVQPTIEADRRELKLLLNQTVGHGTIRNYIELANCLATDSVGNAICVTAAPSGGYYNVETCDIFDSAKMPCIGVIIQKITSTTCKIQLSGVLTGLYTGLTYKNIVVIGTNGKLVHPSSLPDPAAQRHYLQVIGEAASDKDVIMQINSIPIWRVG